MELEPPKWADRLLSRICRPDLLEEIQGDLHESFYWRAETKGYRYARRQFVKETLLSFRFSNLKTYNKMDRFFTLFKSHLKTGLRFILKTRVYSAINIAGLAIGIVFSWFAFLFASEELGYNKHIPDARNIYRLTTQLSLFNNTVNLPGFSHVYVDQIASEFPEVRKVARFTDDKAIMKLPGGIVDQEFLVAEKSLLDMLNLEFVEGAPGAFEAPNRVIISERLAYKLGIRGEAVSSSIELLDSTQYVRYDVIGVYATIPSNSSIQADLILPYVHYLNQDPDNATKKTSFDISALVQIHSGTRISDLKGKIDALINPSEEGPQYMAKMTSLTDLHLSEEYFAIKGFKPGGNMELIWFIVIAGAMCLIISIINYANFSISLYVNRAREMAVRKIIGSANSGVFYQLMTESFLTTLLASFCAVLLFMLIAPTFSFFVDKQFYLADLIHASNLPWIILIIVGIAFVSGVYPSLLLSKLKILKSLKGGKLFGKGNVMTQGLLILQFSISIVMIACMLIFRGQLDYLIHFDKGYNVDDVVKIDIPLDFVGSGKDEVLVQQLQQIPEISSITLSSGYNMTGYQDGDKQFSLTYKNIDSGYVAVMGIGLKEGQLPHEASRNGIANGVVVNESFLEKAGINGDPLGQQVALFENATIVGVIKDYYVFGPVSKLRPILFHDDPDERTGVQVLFKSTADPLALDIKIQEAWEAVFDQIPLRYDYMSALYRDKFKQEDKVSTIAGLGSIIAIFISAFGLLGLVGLTIQRRLKELSVRRVLGAQARQVHFIMVKKFAVPIGISLVMGLGLSIYLTGLWLEDYHNRISFEWYHAAITAVAVIGILMLIVGLQTFNVIRANPVVHLKEE